ncbi:MotE family protein [Sphingobium sp.]|uniref:MotE family protein n=1 Tax=Sphingobium sp. TaxID=1912891 RepID=UPI002BB18DF1|nr:magnesium transporter [Sphingobium sp.]HUD95461.1 magnesium transporter [Sphingobium sp.]
MSPTRSMAAPEGEGGRLRQFVRRPSTLLLGAAGLGVIANALALAAPLSADTDMATRLGISLQDSMAQRDRTLAAEKRKLDMREQAAKAGEARLAAEMRARQGEANAAGAQPGGAAVEPSQPYDDLARIYQTMKPARAAPIFEKLELEVQTQVARRMRERSTALLMAAMSPNAAAELTMSLAGRKVIQQKAPQVARAIPPRRRAPPPGTTPPAGK